MEEMTFEQAINRYASLMQVSLKEAREEAEKLVEMQMNDEHVPREFAEACFIESTEDLTAETLTDMENQAKFNKVNRPQAKAVDAYGKKRTRKVKSNPFKQEAIARLQAILQEMEEVEDLTATNPERVLDFRVGAITYTLTLTEHRDKKKKA